MTHLWNPTCRHTIGNHVRAHKGHAREPFKAVLVTPNPEQSQTKEPRMVECLAAYHTTEPHSNATSGTTAVATMWMNLKNMLSRRNKIQNNEEIKYRHGKPAYSYQEGIRGDKLGVWD